MSDRHGCVLRRTFALLIAIGLFAPGMAHASQDPNIAESGDMPVLTDHQVPLLSSNLMKMAPSMWVWSRAGLGYQLLDNTEFGYSQLAAVELDTGQEVGRLRFAADKLAWGAGAAGAGTHAASGSPNFVAVDEAGGRLFVPWAASAGANCVQATTIFAQIPCLAGVYVINARTLEIERSIPLQPFSAEAGSFGLQLRALSYAPPRGPGDSGKILIAAHDLLVWANGNTAQAEPKFNGANLVYALQLDIESGRQEWIVRVDGCRGSRDITDPGISSRGVNNRPNPQAIMRSPRLDDPAVWIGCYGNGRMGMVVRIPLDANGQAASLPVVVGDPGDAVGSPARNGAQAPASAPAGAAPAMQVFSGPTPVAEMLADPVSERLLMRMYSGQNENGGDEVWWVFDGRARAFIGTIGIGKTHYKSAATALDPATGRFYLAHPPRPGQVEVPGLFMVDIRRTPLPQALRFPGLGSLVEAGVTTGADYGAFPLAVQSAPEGGYPRLFARAENDPFYRTVIDQVPFVAQEVLEETYAGRTLELEEADGVTASAFDGAARGYAARAIIMGGAEGLTRAGPADPLGQIYAPYANTGKARDANAGSAQPVLRNVLPDPCSNADRELVVGFVGPSGPAVVDTTGSRGGAQPFMVDERTRADLEAAASRCTGQDWDALWSNALFGRPPAAEPTVPWLFGDDAAECVSGSERSSDSVGDAVAGSFAAGVDCKEGGASGFSYARGVPMADVGVTEALSSFRIYRDPGRGIVSRVESVARGIGIPGVLRIDSVRATAETWANGRRQPVAAADREADYNPNCDFERSAGSCYQRHAFGVWTPGYSCGPCGDELRLIDGMNRALGANGRVAFRNPDPELAVGSENGFIAAVQKPDTERFGDLVLNNDLLQTVVPTLEIVRLTAPHNYGTGRRGQQLYQFAGVEVSSSYGISCLLVYDEAANTCAGEKQVPGAIQVSLSDPDGKALAGGAFEVRQDVDADGVLGLKDTLLPNGACVTTDDGVGTCKFESLQPGSYLVNQVAAPPGYAKSAEPFVVELASGEQRTVAFTNVSNLSTVELKATDENGAPVSGAVFAAYPDPDSDGKVAPDAKPAAECTTGADGACSMQVPAGSYVLVQTSAPAGLEGIEPVAFTFASGGQVAAVTVVNYPPETPGTVEPEASPVIDYTPPVGLPEPSESVSDYTSDVPVIDEAPAESVPLPQVIGSTVERVIRAPGDALRLLARDPKEAVAWTAALALFCLAVMAIRRRQQAIALIQQ